MREIKFRAWDDEIRYMYYNNYHIIMNMDGTCLNLQTGKNLLPLLFTGLKDKNGKEIYEKDILRDVNGHKFTVLWADDYAEYLGNYGDTDFKADIYIMQECQIIGNSYENPGLLK